MPGCITLENTYSFKNNEIHNAFLTTQANFKVCIGYKPVSIDNNNLI